MKKNSVLDREFLETRSLIMQLAAAMDRVQRCPLSPKKDPRRDLVDSALRLLQDPEGNRAEQMQLLFSKAYDPNWKKTLFK